MHEYLKKELLRLDRQIEQHIAETKAEMDNDPLSELFRIELDFQQFLADTQGKPGERTSKQAMAKIDRLAREKERQKERQKTWDWDKLCDTRIAWEQALGDLNSLLWTHRVERP